MAKFSRLISGEARSNNKGSDSDTSAPSLYQFLRSLPWSKYVARGAGKCNLAKRFFSFMLVSKELNV